MQDEFKHLLSPIVIGSMTLRNRVLVTAHVPGLEQNGIATDAFIAYQRARAHGGAALQISGASSVHWSGSVGKGRGLDCTAPGSVEAYQRLADAIHAEGGRFLIQLGHSAATVNIADAGQPLWAPSSISSELHRELPKAMSVQEIAEIVEAHETATANVRKGGLDGVEILAAFGFLAGAFLSPYSNKRKDDYGGSLENRMRFALELVDAVRLAAGPDLIVGMRIPGEERVPGGLGRNDMIEIAERLSATGKLDYLNVIVGTNYKRIQRAEHWPPTPAPHGLFVHLAEDIRTHSDIPVFTTGRITDPRMADAIIRDGRADMVGMTRAHISDPDFVAKCSSGQVDTIRPCVGANLCISQATEGKPLRCFHNPEAGREAEWNRNTPSGSLKHVVVIGGGPAGLEAARVAAARGHRVSLYEARPLLGGQLRVWAETPQTREFMKTVLWYENELQRAQVKVHSSQIIGSGDIASLEADAIILATGSRRGTRDNLPGEETSQIRILGSLEALAEQPEGTHIVLWDEGGGRGGLSVADALLDRNKITIVTSQYAVGELINPNIRTPLYKRLLGKDAIMRPNETIVRLEGTEIVTNNAYSGKENRICEVDILIDWHGNTACNDLASPIRAHGTPLQVVGDATVPRQVHIAIAEGAMAARSL